MTALGLHLEQALSGPAAARPTVIAALDADGVLVRLDALADDDAVAAALPAGPARLLVDAPLVIPDAGGRRDAETVLAWLDHPTLPVSRRRMDALFGGVRGEILLPRLAAPGREVAETLPELVLRQIVWEAATAPDAPVDLGAYREAWLGCRAPRYRPKPAALRADPAGTLAAWRILAGVVDTAGWAPDPAAGPEASVRDAARIDAIACAYAALRWSGPGAAHLVLGTPERGRIVVPAGPHLRERARVNLERLRAGGQVRI